jgi:hypothetical protein
MDPSLSLAQPHAVEIHGIMCNSFLRTPCSEKKKISENVAEEGRGVTLKRASKDIYGFEIYT